MRTKPRPATVIAMLLVGLVVYVARNWSQWTGSGASTTEVEQGESGSEGAVEDAFRARRSGLVVEVGGVVAKVLPDDRSGDRHQRFLLRLRSGHTVLIAHNIDLAPTVPLRKGDSLRIRGQYEWNAKGGVLHWTHHDPGGRRPGGWIELRGKRYR